MAIMVRANGGLLSGFILLIAAALVAGCPGQDPNPQPAGSALAPPKPAPSPATPSSTQAATDTPKAGEPRGTAPRAQANQAPAPPAQAAFRLVVSAEFTDLPSGAVIVAPSARDRRFQKVTKSDHQGATGSVVPSGDGENLFFVSEPVTGGKATYTGTFEITRRLASQGDLSAAKGAKYDEGKGQVKTPPTNQAVLDAAKTMGQLGPHAALLGVLGAVKKMTLADDGTASEAEVLAGKAATVYGATRTAAMMLRSSAVPAVVNQGFQHASIPSTATRTHTWLQVEMPRLGWAPVDPVMLKTEGEKLSEGDPLYFGLLPPDRAEMVVGDEVSIPETKGINPELKLSGDLAAPFAVKDGSRVGKVTWKAAFELLQ